MTPKLATTPGSIFGAGSGIKLIENAILVRFLEESADAQRALGEMSALVFCPLISLMLI